MNLFGFELTNTVQTLEVICPKCGKDATILFSTKEKNVPIPLSRDVVEALEEAGLKRYFSLPKCNDIHLFCMNCLTSSKMCKTFHTECEIEVKKNE